MNPAGNAEQQHSPMKQMNSPDTIKCDASVHTPLRPAATNSEESMAQEPECCAPSQTDLHSETSQTNSEPNTAQEPQCLGPFVETSSIKCPKCSAVLTYYGEIFTHPCTSEHFRGESGKKKPKCCFCDKEFNDKRNLQRHYIKHVETKYVKCSICGKCFKCESSFKMHAPVHTNRWPYHCDICGQGIASERYLELHKTSHLKEKSWMCDMCGAMFVNQLRLIKHRKVHSEKEHECDICYAKFTTVDYLKRHKKIHSAREKLQCEECSSTFKSKFQFKLHKETKHGDNSGGETFICSPCNKEFKNRHIFKRHMYNHKCKNEDIVYTCDLCKRNFSAKITLKVHIIAHYGKPYSCKHCGMLFTQQGSVRRHILKLHPSE